MGALLVGVAYASTVERTYTASSTVLLNPLAASPLTAEAAAGSGAQLTVALETEAQVVSSPTIAEAVSDRLDRLVPADGETLTVDVPTGTQMVQITFTADSPRAAQEGAQAFAEEFLDYRETRAVEEREATLESLDAQLEANGQLLRDALADAADEGQASSFASRQVGLYTERLSTLNTRASEAEALATDPGRVLNPAERPVEPNEFSTPIILLLAALLGLLAGLAVAWYREWRTDFVRADETTDIGGLPVFAGLQVGAAERRRGYEASTVEAFRRLRIGVVANATRPHVLAVGSLGLDEDALRVAAALAVRLAEARYRVAVVAADPGDRSLEEYFGIADDAPGLSDLLAKAGPGDVAGVAIDREGLTVVPAGPHLAEHRDFLAGQNFRRLLDDMKKDYDYVVVGAAGAGSADGDTVIATADSLLLVVAQDRTTHQQIAGALESLDHLGVRTLGAVTVTRSRRSRQHS
nr:hypothetical protein [Serinicoccus marinus]